jgi:CTP:molybdopterin cytidylyltransferase MocA
MSRNAAILLAAGSGKRMQGAVDDKILAPDRRQTRVCPLRGRFPRKRRRRLLRRRLP